MVRVLFYSLFLFFYFFSTTSGIADDIYQRSRLQMIQLIENDVKETASFLDISFLDPLVMQAMETVPRHEFVPNSQKPYAYQNRPLAIGHGQTISQPYIVALMTHLLNISESSKVLEIGTGSGYQAAILATLVDKIYTIEIIEPLAHKAKMRFQRLGYQNIHSQVGDGYYGIKQHSPYDGIIVTAAASHVPPPLINQLKPGGRMVIPVGSRFLTQQLLLIEKNADGAISIRQILPVRFVPLTGSR